MTVPDARLMLTCGLPGAGKTELAKRLAAERYAVRLTKDEWLWALDSSPWDERIGQKIEQRLWQLAQELLRHGLSVVLDFGLWARAERDELRTVAREIGVGVELYFLDVPVDELWRRSRHATQRRGGPTSRSPAPTSTGGSRSSNHPMPTSSPCSIPRLPAPLAELGADGVDGEALDRCVELPQDVRQAVFDEPSVLA
jgi:predicted kinase